MLRWPRRRRKSIPPIVSPSICSRRKNPGKPKPWKRALKMLREQSIPLTEKKLGDDPRPLKTDELEELARWVDMLDRM